MLIRPATVLDADLIALHAYPEANDQASRAPFAQWVQDAMPRGLYLGFLAQDGVQVVAGAGLLLLEWGPSRGDPHPFRARVKNVWTHPSYRRRGLARELVGRCLTAARQRGVTRLSLGSTAMGRPLYESLGFQASETEMFLRFPD